MWNTLRNELREVLWLASVAGGLSVLSLAVVLAVNTALVG